jgi:prepilin-type processing-associated H-X9-DG protein
MLRGVSMNMHMGRSDFGGQASTYRFFTKSASITKPSRFFVVMDEDDKTINDAMFRTDGQALVGNNALKVNDWPAFYHGGSGGISFADGHAEMHKWKEIANGPPAGHTAGGGSTIQAPMDKEYLLKISTEPVNRSY